MLIIDHFYIILIVINKIEARNAILDFNLAGKIDKLYEFILAFVISEGMF